MDNAKQIIERFWDLQNSGDYTKVVPLFAEDAILVDPFFGEFKGREAIAGFMAKMVAEMGERKTHFTVREISGDEHTAWAQWVAHTPAGDVEGCGLYKVANGFMTYYKDYMNGPSDRDAS